MLHFGNTLVDIWNFISNHWRIILEGGLIVILFILQFIKKRPIAYTYKDYISSALSLLPYWIQTAEKAFPHDGSKKKAYVMEHAFNYVSKKVLMTELQMTECKDTISNIIEAILETPQKK